MLRAIVVLLPYYPCDRQACIWQEGVPSAVQRLSAQCITTNNLSSVISILQHWKSHKTL